MCQSCQSNPDFERFEMKKMKLYITFHIYIYIIRIEMAVLSDLPAPTGTPHHGTHYLISFNLNRLMYDATALSKLV